MKQKNLETKIKRLDEKGVIPTRAHEDDSGFDITVIGVKKIKGDTIYFTTGLAIKPPDGHYFEIFPRSSISETPFMLANSVAVIDESYRGELLIPIRVIHPNSGNSNERDSYPSGMINTLDARPSSISEVAKLIIAKKPKLVQMVLKKRIDTNFVEVSELDETERGHGGFGSTDKNN